MIFKGTENRNPYEISKEVEDRGGMLDAFTAKEMMAVYSKIPGEDLEIAVDVIGDLFSHPLFKKDDIEKERNVVLEEYKEFLDDPDENLHSMVYESLFFGHPLSKEILGTEESIKKFKRENILDYWSGIFLPENLVIIAAGDVEHEKFVEHIQDHFKLKKANELKERTSFPFRKPLLRKKIYPHLRQVQCMIAFRTFGFADERRYHLMISNSVIGGNMSSKLFQKLREELGLVYTISSFVDFHSDTGIFGISFSVDLKNLSKTFKVIQEELRKIKEEGLKEEELERAKSFSLGNLAISLENTSTRLLRLANLEIYLSNYIDVDTVMQKVKDLSIKEVNDTLNEIMDNDRMGISMCIPDEKIEIEDVISL
jgi:predicted Zn-dependent peptidase